MYVYIPRWDCSITGLPIHLHSGLLLPKQIISTNQGNTLSPYSLIFNLKGEEKKYKMW